MSRFHVEFRGCNWMAPTPYNDRSGTSNSDSSVDWLWIIRAFGWLQSLETHDIGWQKPCRWSDHGWVIFAWWMGQFSFLHDLWFNNFDLELVHFLSSDTMDESVSEYPSQVTSRWWFPINRNLLLQGADFQVNHVKLQGWKGSGICFRVQECPRKDCYNKGKGKHFPSNIFGVIFQVWELFERFVYTNALLELVQGGPLYQF